MEHPFRTAAIGGFNRQDVLDFFGLLCFGQNEWAGQPFELLPWEREAIQGF